MSNKLGLTPGVLFHTCDQSSQRRRRLKDCKLETGLGSLVSLRIA